MLRIGLAILTCVLALASQLECAEPSPNSPRTDLYGDPLPEGAIARIGSVRLRHPNLADFHVRNDGKSVVTTGGDLRLHYWDLTTGALINTVKLDGDASERWHSAEFSADGQTLAGMFTDTIVFWDVRTGKKSYTHPFRWDLGPPWSWLSPDGRRLAVMSPDRRLGLKLIDRVAGQERTVPLPGNGQLRHFCFSPDGRWLVGCPYGKTPTTVIDSATLREMHRIDYHSAASTISADSKLLALATSQVSKGSRQTVIRVFDLPSVKEVRAYPLGVTDEACALAFSPDNKLIAFGHTEHSCLLELGTGRITQRLPPRAPGEPHIKWKSVFTPDSRTLVFRCGNLLRLWDIANALERCARPGDLDWATATVLSNDGAVLATSNYVTASIELWNTKNGQLRRTIPTEDSLSGLCFAINGQTLYAMSIDGLFQSWSVGLGASLATFQLKDPTTERHPYAFYVAPERQQIVTIDWCGRNNGDFEKRLTWWDSKNQKLIAQFPLPQDVENGVWSADGKLLTFFADDSICVVEAEIGTRRFHIPNAWGGRGNLSPDSRLVVTNLMDTTNTQEDSRVSPAAVVVWDTQCAREVATFPILKGYSFAVAADNRSLVTINDNVLRVWDIATGHERHRWNLPVVSPSFPSLNTQTLSLSSDGRRAFTALADGTGLIWDLTPALQPKEPLVKNPSEKDIAAWWDDLANVDAKKAYAAIWRLAEVPPSDVVAYFRPRLKPAAAADFKLVQQALAELDSPTFAVREKAFKRLEDIGGIAHPAMREALTKNPSAEVRRQLEALLARPSGLITSPLVLQRLRAIQVLEHLGTKDARDLLGELANGAVHAIETKDAKASLERLVRRTGNNR